MTKTNSFAPRFTCCECHRNLPVSQLSEYSLAVAGTDSKSEALLHLRRQDVVCVSCEAEQDEELYGQPETQGHAYARTDYERFAFSGLQLDPARLTAYYLSN